jgi:YVTN family beta-propeller protein
LGVTIVFLAIGLSMLLPENLYHFRAAAQGGAGTVKGFPYSTPITLNNAGNQLWVINPDPDNNSVTAIDVTGDLPRVLAEIPVGKEPTSIALNGDGSAAYVTNALDGTVSVINTTTLRVVGTIKVGVEPQALCFTPEFQQAVRGLLFFEHHPRNQSCEQFGHQGDREPKR